MGLSEQLKKVLGRPAKDAARAAGQGEGPLAADSLRMGEKVYARGVGVMTVTDTEVLLPGHAGRPYVLLELRSRKLYLARGTSSENLRRLIAEPAARRLLEMLRREEESACIEDYAALHREFEAAIESMDAEAMAMVLKKLYRVPEPRSFGVKKLILLLEDDHVFGELAAVLELGIAEIAYSVPGSSSH